MPHDTHAPATRAMWAAHRAAADTGLTADLGPIERIAAAAVAAYLSALADHNDIEVERREDASGGRGGASVQRPLYPRDLRRMAAQLTDLPEVGPDPNPAPW
jgi:hypothetical protein